MSDDLPNRRLLRISEVADFFGVGERCVRLWIEHGQLKAVATPGGGVRVEKRSVESCFYVKRRKKV